jgi:SAM-dependent methyltransferase
MSFYSDFAEYYEEVFPFEEPVYEFLLERLPDGGRVLDVGCGTGDYCGKLTGAGLDAVGIDLDPEMIAAARLRHSGLEFHAMDMLGVGALDGPFAGAFCIGNVISHITHGELDTFLSDLASLLVPGAPWVMQLVNWDYLLTKESHRFPDVPIRDGKIVFERRYPSIDEENVTFVTRLQGRDEAVFEGAIELHPLCTEKCVRLHEKRGFLMLDHLGSFRGKGFEPGVPSSSIFVFRAPEA